MSRTYHISDFAAFLRKYGDSAHDRGGWEKSVRDDYRPGRPDRGTDQEFRHRKMEMTAGAQSIVSATANIPCGNPKSKPSAR